ncbi:hypothetical protein [Legionella sp. km772]|uniref:hypothetical protein n=1 Tax=Legionella sp. km772 TaxID=2498111 RepID=UPI000F8F7228|nr:hypothetical protein [Legionella sp. km772]RUR12465.1 hypothetical protein ELY15_05095 [Legionella sp. km772]
MTITSPFNGTNPLSPLSQTIKKPSDLHEQLDFAQKRLLACLDSLTSHSSIFTKASLTWHQSPWWQKITVASIVCFPLIIGLICQVSGLALVGLSLVIFASLSLFLVENHVQQQQLQTAEIKATVQGLMQLLGTILKNLESLNQQLGEEVQTIKERNELLVSRCGELQEETQRLANSNHSLDQNQKELLSVQAQLKTTILTIDSTVSEQTLLLNKNQTLLDETTLAYQENQQQLAAAIGELDEVKKLLAVEVDKAQRVTQTLKNAVQVLGQEALGDQHRRDQFFQKLDRFINDQEMQFDMIVKGLAVSGQQLSETANEIKANSLRFNHLLAQQEQQLARLTKLELPQVSAADLKLARQKHGFYNTPEPQSKAFAEPTRTAILAA